MVTTWIYKMSHKKPMVTAGFPTVLSQAAQISGLQNGHVRLRTVTCVLLQVVGAPKG